MQVEQGVVGPPGRVGYGRNGHGREVYGRIRTEQGNVGKSGEG